MKKVLLRARRQFLLFSHKNISCGRVPMSSHKAKQMLLSLFEKIFFESKLTYGPNKSTHVQECTSSFYIYILKTIANTFNSYIRYCVL